MMREQVWVIIVLLLVLILTGCGEISSSVTTPSSSNKTDLKLVQQQNSEQPKVSILESYKPNLVIYDIKINDYPATNLDSATTFINGYVKNNGNKTLKRLEVTIYYLDNNDKPISEDKSAVTLEGINSYKDPIKPNYQAKFVKEVPQG